MSDKDKRDNITELPHKEESPQIVRRIGTMKMEKYWEEAPKRTEVTPGIVGTDAQVMQIAKGMGRKIFNNPLELAYSLQGFEDFCEKKNISPSFIGLSIFLNISKGTLLKYLKDSTEFTVMVVSNSITGEYIYSNTDKAIFDKYIESTYEVDKEGNSISIKESIEKGIYYIEYKSISFEDVLTPVRSLIELSITNKGFDMKNPAMAIFTMKNRFGETDHYTDEQQISITTTNPIDDMQDSDVLRAAQSLPE